MFPAFSQIFVIYFFTGQNNLPANIGKDNKSNIAVINIAHTNKGILCIESPGALIFNIVAIKFIAPNRELIPSICNANIAKSTAGPE
jgi:hypothetical protein